MSRTIKVSTWGKLGLGHITVRVRDGETGCEAAVRSIERRTRLAHFGGPCPQGSSVSSGTITDSQYSMTLGVPARPTGISVRGEIWFSVPADQGRSR